MYPAYGGPFPLSSRFPLVRISLETANAIPPVRGTGTGLSSLSPGCRARGEEMDRSHRSDVNGWAAEVLRDSGRGARAARPAPLGAAKGIGERGSGRPEGISGNARAHCVRTDREG